MLWRGGRDAEQWELAKQMSWGLSASSLVWEPSEYGSNAMSFMEKKRLQVTEMLNLEAHVQGKKQHDLFKSMPEGNAKEEMRRILKLHKVLGEEGATHAVQERQQFHVYRHCSTDGGKTLPFTLEFALVSEFNGAILGCPVSFKAKKWPTWKVSKLEQEILSERVKLPNNLGTPVSPRTLRDLLKTLDNLYDEMILKNEMRLISGLGQEHKNIQTFNANVARLQLWRGQQAADFDTKIRAPLRAIELADVNKDMLDTTPAISVVTQLTAHVSKDISAKAFTILKTWEHIIQDRRSIELASAEVDEGR